MNVYEVVNNEDSIIASYVLNENSPFYLPSNPWNVSNSDYSYVLTSRFLSWYQIVNGKSYKVALFFPNDGQAVSPVVYEWTMSLSASQIEEQEQQTQADINSGIMDLNNNINNTNNFLQDTNYDTNTIIDNMPAVDIPEDFPPEVYLDSLFESFIVAFTSEDAQDFEFVVPFSNGQIITIPANYIADKLPSAIVTLIRAFYWAVISMYILKDVWNYIDRLRQGDLFLTNDKDIKTEVL